MSIKILKLFSVMGVVLFVGGGQVVLAEDSTGGYDVSKLGEIKTQFDEYYLDGRIPNYVFGLYSKDRLIYSATNGRTKIDGGQDVNLNTIYWMASMTKPVVSAAIMKLVEDGDLKLDDELSKFYPEFSDMLVAPGGSYDNTLEEAKTPITLRHLISHTSGLTYGTGVTGVGDVARQYDEFGMMFCYGPGGKTLQEHIEVLAQLPLISHPGEAWNYSVGIDVLGAVIEKVKNQKLDVYLKEAFFEPLKMNNSGFFIPPEKRNIASRIYTSLDASQITQEESSDGINWKIGPGRFYQMMESEEDIKPSNCASGGGGLLASVEDFAMFLQMIANGGTLHGNRVLKEETVALMFEDQTSTLLPEAFTRAFGEDVSSYMKFTAGFGMKMIEKEVDYFFWGGAANTFFWLDKANDSLGVFATQLAPSVYNVSDSIEEIVDQARL